MGGWMFFPSDNSRRNWSLEDFLDDFSSVGSQPSRDEWYEHVPESRERLQGRTLGFLGGMNVTKTVPPGQSDLPAYPMQVFISDLTLMPTCWNSQTVLSVPSGRVDIYRIVGVGSSPLVITVTGTLPDRPPVFRVCGSYCFFPPPYVMAEQKHCISLKTER